MNKTIKIILTSCAVLVSLSLFYYLVVRPLQKDKPFRDCINLIEASSKRVQENYTKALADGKNPSIFSAIANLKEMEEDCYKNYK